MRNQSHGLRGDDMPFLLAVESCDTLDDHVVGLRGTRSEYNVLSVRPNKICDALSNQGVGVE
jgi:hypothetical protein